MRRERLGERIIALQQLVSPFGKVKKADASGFWRYALYFRSLYLYLPFGVSFAGANVDSQITASLSAAVKHHTGESKQAAQCNTDLQAASPVTFSVCLVSNQISKKYYSNHYIESCVYEVLNVDEKKLITLFSCKL